MLRTVRLFDPTPGGLAFALELALIIGDANEMDIVASIRVIKMAEIRRGDFSLRLDIDVGEPHRLSASRLNDIQMAVGATCPSFLSSGFRTRDQTPLMSSS